MTKHMFAAVLLSLSLATPASAEMMAKLNDLEIAHAAYTADVIDIDYGKIALAKSKNAEVRAFAELMIRDHSAVNDGAAALLTKLNVKPQDNDFSKALIKGADAKKAEFAGLEGAAFDCAYAKNELGYHQVVNKTVETEFIPAVTVPELKEFLVQALVTFKAHEGHAAAMVKTLSCP